VLVGILNFFSLPGTLRTNSFNIYKCYILITFRLYVHRKKQRLLPSTTLKIHVGFCNRGGECLQRGAGLVLI
jgi:hypothetical protein